MRVCVIDDDEIFHFIISRQIAMVSDDVELMSFLNSAEALKFLTANVGDDNKMPDLILLDILMPEVNGLDLARQLKKVMRKEIPVCFITSSLYAPMLDKVKRSPLFYKLLIKPIQFEQLEELLDDTQAVVS